MPWGKFGQYCVYNMLLISVTGDGRDDDGVCVWEEMEW